MLTGSVTRQRYLASLRHGAATTRERTDRDSRLHGSRGQRPDAAAVAERPDDPEDQQAAPQGRGLGRRRLGAAERDALRVPRHPVGDLRPSARRSEDADRPLSDGRRGRAALGAPDDRRARGAPPPGADLNLPAPSTMPEPFTAIYRIAMAVCYPLVGLWGRLQVEGLEALPRSGPTLIIANHDSQTDPLAVGVAARKHRQIRALANAIDALRAGACIGVFPEGTISVGRTLRARSGIGRLALEVPEARLVCTTVQGCPDIARFPKRPRIRVRFFEPAAGQADPSESPAALSQRLLDEIRTIAPPVDAGRDPAKTFAQYERKLAEREEAAAKRRADAAERERV